MSPEQHLKQAIEALEAVNEALKNGDLIGDPSKMFPMSGEAFANHVKLITKVQAALAVAGAE